MVFSVPFFFKKTTGVAVLVVGVGQTHSLPRKPSLGRVSESFFIGVKIKEENYHLGK